MCVICLENNLVTLSLITNVDPTRTTSTRRRFVAEVDRRFRALKDVVREHIESGALLERDILSDILLVNATAAQWRSRYDPNKIPEFMDWLEDQNNKFILSKEGAGIEVFTRQGLPYKKSVSDSPRIYTTKRLGMVEGKWSDVYIRSAYQKGVQRTRNELRKQGMSIPSFEAAAEGLSGVFNVPFHVDRVQLAYTQTYAGMQGITKSMEAPIARTMALGMAEGRNPRELAREIAGIKGAYKDVLNKRRGIIDKKGWTNARTLARTEVIRAHHGANIAEMRAYGIEEVYVKAEWLTAGDNRVCPRCEGREGRIYKLDEIEPEIPLHPNCRCVAIPIVPRKGRKRRRRVKRPAEEVVVKKPVVKRIKVKQPIVKKVEKPVPSWKKRVDKVIEEKRKIEVDKLLKKGYWRWGRDIVPRSMLTSPGGKRELYYRKKVGKDWYIKKKPVKKVKQPIVKKVEKVKQPIVKKVEKSKGTPFAPTSTVDGTIGINTGVNKSIKVEFEDGPSALFKPNVGEPKGRWFPVHGAMAQREVVAYEIAAEMGMASGEVSVPYTAMYKFKGKVSDATHKWLHNKVGSAQKWVDKKGVKLGRDFTAAEKMAWKRLHPNLNDLQLYSGTEQGARLRILDFILDNNDRHSGNYMATFKTVRKGDYKGLKVVKEVFAIDNGLCMFPNTHTGLQKLIGNTAKISNKVRNEILNLTPKKVKNILTEIRRHDASGLSITTRIEKRLIERVESMQTVLKMKNVKTYDDLYLAHEQIYKKVGGQLRVRGTEEVEKVFEAIMRERDEHGAKGLPIWSSGVRKVGGQPKVRGVKETTEFDLTSYVTTSDPGTWGPQLDTSP